MGNVVLFTKNGGKRMENILEVAKYFLSIEPMSHKKLQKLCYYAQAWYLAIYKRRLMDVDFEAWVHGPVSALLYNQYRDWGGLVITGLQSIPHLEESTVNFLSKIYSLYGKFTATELEKMTHDELPWIEARGKLAKDVPCKNKISDVSMQSFYGGLIGV